MLDNMVAGGIATGFGIKETMVKECWEEAQIPEEIAKNVRPVGCIRCANYHQISQPYEITTAFGSYPQIMANYDGKFCWWFLFEFQSTEYQLMQQGLFSIKYFVSGARV